MKAVTGVSSWLVGQGINAVSEIEETARIAPLFGWENQASDRDTRSRSSGFPGDNLFEPNSGARAKTSATNRRGNVLRWFAPPRATDFGFRPPVERSEERNAESRIAFGGASLKEIVLSSRFSRFFLLGLPWPRTYLLRRSPWLLFERLRHDSRAVRPRQSDELVG
jgi:hypothetical protein